MESPDSGYSNSNNGYKDRFRDFLKESLPEGKEQIL